MTHATYAVHPTPVGDALIVATDEGLVSLHLTDAVDADLERLAHRLGTLPEPDEQKVEAVARQLDEYFAGERREFDVDLDWRLVRGFTRAALEAIRDIPYGETASYGEVAVRAGSPGASRAAGTACATTPFSIVVPAHRVVRADGSVGEYGGHPEVKRFLLDLERDAVAPGVADE